MNLASTDFSQFQHITFAIFASELVVAEIGQLFFGFLIQFSFVG